MPCFDIYFCYFVKKIILSVSIWENTITSAATHRSTDIESMIVRRKIKVKCKKMHICFVFQVHASPQRYHSAFIGASALANLQEFEQACITSDEWRETGPACLRKWHMY